jgi:diguanylate cyclase (GGDEF)-like protein
VSSYQFPSLAEQLNITESEVRDRKRLFEISPADEEALQSCREIIDRNADETVTSVCKWLCQHPDFYKFIGDRDTYERWMTDLKVYIRELFNGTYELSYVTRRLLIGKLQYKLNIPPKYYMAGSRFLQEVLSEVIRRETNGDRGVASARLAALRKIALLDAHFILDAYTAMMVIEVDVAKKEVRNYVEGLEQRAKELSELSRRDDLTGLMNRRAFAEEARRAITLAQRSRYPVSLVYFDLDGFKSVNDMSGHLAGDDVLKRVSQAVYKSIRDTDIACRYGGDEFLLLLPTTPADQAKVVCERLRANYGPTGDGDIDFSFGIAQVGPRAYATVDEAVRLADNMMYKAKSDRNNGASLRIYVKCIGE